MKMDCSCGEQRIPRMNRMIWVVALVLLCPAAVVQDRACGYGAGVENLPAFPLRE